MYIYLQHNYTLTMNQQNNRNSNIQNALISEYEAMSQKGTVGFYEETVFLTLIEYYQKAELLGKAMEVVDHAIKQHSYSSTFHKKKAELLLEKGCATQALTCLDQAELFSPSEFETILLRVESLNMLGYYEEAHALLQQLEKQASKKELSEIFLSKAILFESRQEFKNMFLALKKSILNDSSNTEALSRIWFSVEMSRCFDDSIVLHKRLIDLDPYNYVAWYNLGYSYNAKGDHSEAADAFEYAYLINNQFEFAYRDCANACLKLHQYQRALDCYKEALEYVKPDSDIMVNMGFCFEQLNDLSKAKSFYLKAAQLNPLNDNVYYRLGECYNKEEKWNSAIAAYEKALSIEDLKEEYYTALGKCYFQVNEFDLAEKFYSKATEIAPEISTCWIQYTFFLLETGAFESVFETLEEARFYSYGIELSYCKIACLFEVGERAEALKLLNDTLAENDFKEQEIYKYLPSFRNDSEVKSIISIYSK